jgi:eukaryotic-like serine/threonine-protein kinase
MDARSIPTDAPKKLGRYEVRAKIAEGGMATVYVGREMSPQGEVRVCALKVIRGEFSANPEFVAMFADEAKIVARLRHPSIVRMLELGVEGVRVFIAMELLDGQSLWTMWDACRAKGVRLRYDVIAWIGARVAEGLAYAHAACDDAGHPLEIVHRDINATNIFVTYSGDVKIIDFGLAKARNRTSRTAAGVIKGKVAYMAPEQAVGAPLDGRADVFALGTTLWELAVDRRLFKHTDDIETLKRVHAAEVPDPRSIASDFPDRLWGILRRALAREVGQRYQSAAEMARELDAFAQSEGRQVTPAVVAEVMQQLFAEEKTRQLRWLADASAADRPAPAETMKPPATFYARGDSVDVVPLAPPVPSDLLGAVAPSLSGRATFSPPARPPLAVAGPATPHIRPAPHSEPALVPHKRIALTIVWTTAALVVAALAIFLALRIVG